MSDEMYCELNDYDKISTFFKEPVGYLKINNSIRMKVYDKMPSGFHRWMARVLLGWKYEEYKEDA